MSEVVATIDWAPPLRFVSWAPLEAAVPASLSLHWVAGIAEHISQGATRLVSQRVMRRRMRVTTATLRDPTAPAPATAGESDGTADAAIHLQAAARIIPSTSVGVIAA